jgi:O-methyltransferase
MFPDPARVRWALRGLPDLRLAWTLYQISTHTMTRPVRAKALWKLCGQALRAGVPGDFVECGVWMGGSAGLMAVILQRFDQVNSRKLHLFDSFEGLPEPSDKDGAKAAKYWNDSATSEDLTAQRCIAGSAAVRYLLHDRLGIPESRVVIHPGWFQSTLPNLGAELNSIAILRLDGDWYESTKVCFDNLYNRVSPGGVVLLDDYFCWEGCRKATDEFRTARGIKEPMIRIDSDSGYWVKNTQNQSK